MEGGTKTSGENSAGVITITRVHGEVYRNLRHGENQDRALVSSG